MEDALKRLDNLTQEEARMATAEILRLTRIVDNKVTTVDDKVTTVDGKVTTVDNKVMSVDNKVTTIDNKVTTVDNKVTTVDNKVTTVVNGKRHVSNSGCVILTRERWSDGKETKQMVQQIASSVDDMKCLSSVASVSDNPNAFVGDQVRECLRRWVTPPDPSTNHTIACGIQHDGSAQWFFRGSIFSEWKSTGSLLWIYGKRMFFPIGSPGSVLIIIHILAGSGKSILWSVVARTCTLVRPAYVAA